MTYQEKLAKAKAKLMLEHPYIGSLATTLKTVDDPETLTFSSDGVRLTYNPEYFEKVPLDEIEFALANGAMHAVLKHLSCRPMSTTMSALRGCMPKRYMMYSKMR